ncbi:MAG: hypothetical protein ABI567_01690 [Gammaproteobacteria bacterium]
MPTESTFLFAGLLFLAAALGYVFARFGDTDEEEEAEEKTRASFLRGFRYLLNEESDRAVDVFTEVGDLSDDAMDTQLALGTLFRRRGEMERAIRLHQNLVDRPRSSPAQREAASFALAEDYLSSGLFDRAEDLFNSLRNSRVHGPESIRCLLRICEVTSDWDRAVDLCAEINRVEPGGVHPGQISHYYCELAEQARREQGSDVARRLLDQARAVDPLNVRAVLIQADLAADAHGGATAVQSLVSLAMAQPDLLGEVLPRLLMLAEGGNRERIADVLQELAGKPNGLRGIALAVIRDNRITDPLAVQYLAVFLAGQPAMRALLVGEQAGARPSMEAVQRLRPLLNKVLAASARYQCSNCGYGSAAMHWQCPGCRTWGSVRPVSPSGMEALLTEPVSA